MHSVRTTAATLLVGGVLAVLYLAVAYAAVQLLLFPVLGRLRPLPTVVTVLGAAVGFGYLTYRVGTAQLLAGLDLSEPSRQRAPGLYRILDGLDAEMTVDRPRLLLSHTGEPNAFSLGGRRGVVVLDEALLVILSPDELEAVLAHELAHLETRDGLLKTVGASAVSTASSLLFLALLPFGLAVAVVRRLARLATGQDRVPLRQHLVIAYVTVWLAVLGVMLPFTLALRAYARRRELTADDRAAEVAGPLALAEALDTIRRATTPEGGPFSSLYIRGDEEGSLTRLLATHPSMDERIERLHRRADRDRRIRVQ